jgi:hypothetical protein
MHLGLDYIYFFMSVSVFMNVLLVFLSLKFEIQEKEQLS